MLMHLRSFAFQGPLELGKVWVLQFQWPLLIRLFQNQSNCLCWARICNGLYIFGEELFFLFMREGAHLCMNKAMLTTSKNSVIHCIYANFKVWMWQNSVVQPTKMAYIILFYCQECSEICNLYSSQIYIFFKKRKMSDCRLYVT